MNRELLVEPRSVQYKATMALRIRLSILFAGWTAACGKNTDQSDGLTGQSETNPSTVSSGTDHYAGTSGPTTSGTSTGIVLDTTSNVSSDDSGASTTLPMGDLGGADCDPRTQTFCCDPWTQNCPSGEKCSWFDPGGADNWVATKCFPIMESPAPVGADCFVIGSVLSGQDNCDRGSICWDVIDGVGQCVALCTGSSVAPKCPGKHFCRIYEEGLSVCYESCDPLVQDCTSPGNVCVWNYESNFICMNDMSGDEGQVHDPCDQFLKCDPGNVCASASAAVECDAEQLGCCEPFCDTSLPNSCPGQGQECVPVNMPLPPGDENVGVCALPG